MSNMSYVRWENTNGDVVDCLDSIDIDGDTLSKSELVAAKDLFDRVFEFAADHGCDLDARACTKHMESVLDKYADGEDD
jgi:hypothetical protein